MREHFESNFPEISYKKIQRSAEAEFKKRVSKEGTFVLEQKKTPIGYLSVGTQKFPSIDAREGVIYMVHVAKKFRGKGYSHILMRFADKYFKKNKVAYSSVGTCLANKVAIGLYERHGYKPWRIKLKKWYR